MSSTEHLAYEHKQLALTVEAMRAKQRLYFATKTASALREAKHLEAQVDKLIAEWRKGQGEARP